MAAKYILAAVGAIFLVMGLAKLVTARGPQGRTWVLVGVIFTVVSAWLFWQERAL